MSRRIIFPAFPTRRSTRTSLTSARAPRLTAFFGVASTVSALLFASACSDEDLTTDPSSVGGKDDDKDKDDEGAPATKDGGKAPLDAGDKPVQPPTKVMDAGTVRPTPPSADGATVLPDPSSGDASTGQPGTGGPVVLPDPAMPGPYEVTKEINVGVGFENPAANANDRGDGTGCTSFVMSFGETAEAAKEYATLGPDYDIELYTMYRPKTFEEGKQYPIISWANGTCAKVIGYEALLNHVASHGFIVIAAHSRYTGSGKEQMRAVDFVTKQNDVPESPLYKHVDATRVGIFGHSQGGSSTWTAASDKRVKTSIILNSSGSGTRPTPSFFITGDNDIPGINTSAKTAAERQTAAAYVRYHKVPTASLAGHITLLKEPERVYPAVVAWFRYQLLDDDAAAKAYFVGSDCKLCNQAADFDFFQKGLK